MRKISVGTRLYVSIMAIFLLFAIAFIVFQQVREKQYKIELLNEKLQDYNKQLADAMKYMGKTEKLYRTNFEKESKGVNFGAIGAAALGTYVAGSVFGGHIPSGGEAAAVAAGTSILMTSAKDIKKLMLPGTKAKTTTSTQPVFRFYFNHNSDDSFKQNGGNFYELVMNDIMSPNEFQCVKMTVKAKKKGGRRIFPDNMSYTVMGFEGSNASSRVMVDFTIKTINNTTFEVSFPQPLEPGEYVFFYKNGLNNQYFKTAPFGFDFSVE